MNHPISARNTSLAVVWRRLRGVARTVRHLRVALALTLAWVASASMAQDTWPNRPIRMVVPQTPGGSMDTNARAMVDLISRELGQNVVIDNRGGANGIIAGEMVAHSPPDGYTVFYTSNSMINNQLVKAKPPFDVLRDFEPVTKAHPGCAVVPAALDDAPWDRQPSPPAVAYAPFVSEHASYARGGSTWRECVWVGTEC